jgi:NADH dehydrogenase
VEAASRALGRPLPVRYVQPGEPLPLLPETMAQLLTSMEMGPDQFIDMSQTAATFGIAPTTLEAFAERFFGVG